MNNIFSPSIPRNWLIAAKNLSPPEEAKAFRLDTIEEEISLLEKALYRNDQHIGFCHNDLQYGNIMIDEETKSITIIVSFFFPLFHIMHDFLTSILTVKFYVNFQPLVSSKFL